MTPSATRVEVEVKVAIGQLEQEQRRLQALGGVVLHGRCWEQNILFDTPDGSLASRGAILRLRMYGTRSFLAYKAPSQGAAAYKARLEIETQVSDHEQVEAALLMAGLVSVWRYEKYRTVMRLGGVEVALDETPIGHYAELEGTPGAIDSVARGLGWAPARYLTESYRALYLGWCQERGLTPGDMLMVREAQP